MALLGGTPVLVQDDCSAGKSIELIVPFSSGGANFLSAKFLDRYFRNSMPGNPRLMS